MFGSKPILREKKINGCKFMYAVYWAFLVAQLVENLPARQETPV